jgi:hypothetical protein
MPAPGRVEFALVKTRGRSIYGGTLAGFGRVGKPGSAYGRVNPTRMSDLRTGSSDVVPAVLPNKRLQRTRLRAALLKGEAKVERNRSPLKRVMPLPCRQAARE